MDKNIKKPMPFQSHILTMEALLNNDDNITSIDNSFRFKASCNRTTISNINKHIKNIIGYNPVEKHKHLSNDGKVYSTYHLVKNDDRVLNEIETYLLKLKNKSKIIMDKRNKVNDKVVKFGDHSTLSSLKKPI